MHRLALIGFGVVGQGFAEILGEHGAAYREKYGLDARIVAVSDLMKGAVYHPDGLDIAALLAHRSDLSQYPDAPGLVRGLDALRTIRETNADTIIEVSYTDLKTGEPALSHIRAAFESGKNAILTNKGPVALAYRELQALADAKGCYFGYEGTVMSGTPSLRMARKDLAGCTFAEVRGILNGTTNYILTRMANGDSYTDALAEAQRLGYAEADPTGDVEGFDAAGKLVILVNTVFGTQIGMDDVARKGITGLTVADIEAAKSENARWKLIARVVREPDGTIRASVAPEPLPLSDPLANVNGATNAITYSTDLMGAVTLIGAGAGRRETGFAILSDLMELHSSKAHASR
jgi:homoserine dehydrogenase